MSDVNRDIGGLASECDKYHKYFVIKSIAEKSVFTCFSTLPEEGLRITRPEGGGGAGSVPPAISGLEARKRPVRAGNTKFEGYVGLYKNSEVQIW